MSLDNCQTVFETNLSVLKLSVLHGFHVLKGNGWIIRRQIIFSASPPRDFPEFFQLNKFCWNVRDSFSASQHPAITMNEAHSIFFLFKTPIWVWNLCDLYQDSSIAWSVKARGWKGFLWSRIPTSGFRRDWIVAWKQVSVVVGLPVKSGFGSNSRLGVKLSQSNSFFPPVFPLMNGTNWLKTLVGGDERAGCYSVREWRGFEHKKRLDWVQTDVGAHSGEPWVLYAEERL